MKTPTNTPINSNPYNTYRQPLTPEAHQSIPAQTAPPESTFHAVVHLDISQKMTRTSALIALEVHTPPPQVPPHALR